MFELSLLLKHTPRILMFKEKADADKAMQAIYDLLTTTSLSPNNDRRVLSLKDDFAQEVCISAEAVDGYVLEDTDASQEAVIMRHLHGVRTQMKAQRRQGQDSELKALGVGLGGVPQFSPMGPRQ